MRIFYDHQATSLQDAGGLSRYHYELARELGRQDGVRLEYFLGLNASVMPFADLRGQGARVVSWPALMRPGYLRYALNALATSAVMPLRGIFDVYHSTYQRYERAVRSKALVTTHHDSTQERYPELFRNAGAIRQRKRELYKRADAIICISAASKADLLHFYEVDEVKTAVIYHGFSPLTGGVQHESEAVMSLTQPKLLHKPPYLLYVGSRSRYKNFAALLEAFASLSDTKLFAASDYRLHVAGGGAWTADERAHIASRRLGDRVLLTPKVSETALATLYRGAALFVYPSLHEGFGFPPLEAMSQGCPVLASNTSSMPEICGNAAFYFDPSTPGDLAHELERLLASETMRCSKQAIGLAQVQRYSWRRTAVETLRVYKRVQAAGAAV